MERENDGGKIRQEKRGITRISIYIFVLCLLAIGIFQFGPNEMHEKIISKQLELRYPGDQISKLTLQYVDWSSTIQDMDRRFDYEYHKATMAEVLMSCADGERFISLEKGLIHWRTDKKYYSTDYEGKTYSIDKGGSGGPIKYKVIDGTVYNFVHGEWEVGHIRWYDIPWMLRQYDYKEIGDK